MGMVGANGAGKSTLLKILTGTIQATGGSFRVDGKISSLLELGTGFHPEFTGRQNILFGARMAGLSDAELTERLGAIIDFSELGHFIDQPVRTYSSGMALRLGFALASSLSPGVLIVDEALAVGDLHFQQKCLRRIRQIHEAGATILFVSHDPSMIKRFCDRAILLDEGRLIDEGEPGTVLDYYTALMAEKYRDGGGRARIVRPLKTEDGRAEAAPVAESEAGEGTESSTWHQPPLRATGHRTGNFKALITSVYLEGGGAHGNANILATGTPTWLHVRWTALEAVESATTGIAIKDRLGQEIFGVNTLYRNRSLQSIPPGRTIEVVFQMPMNLGEGLYSVTAAVHSGENHTEDCFDWVEQALTLQVLPNPQERFTGLVRLPTEIEIQSVAAPAEELDFARQTRHRLIGTSSASRRSG